MTRTVSRYRLESLIQLAAITSAGVYLVNYVSADLLSFYAFFSLLFALFGCGWPFAVPCGRVVGKGILSGVLMTASCFVLAFSVEALSRVVLADKVSYAAVLFLWIAFLWGLALSSWPLFHRLPSKSTVLAGLIIVALGYGVAYLTSTAISLQTLYNLSVTHVALMTLFSPQFVLQGYPFVNLWRQPRIGIAIASVTFPFASLFNGIFQAENLAAFFSSVVLWSILYSWSFIYLIGLRWRQPTRGILTLPLVLSISFLWTFFLGVFVSLEMVSTVNLLFILPAVITHNIFWLRKPFLHPLLVGMPPPAQTEVEKLFDWRLQLR